MTDGSGLAALFCETLPADTILSDALIIAERYGRNVSGLERRIPLVLRPSNEVEVSRIVALANAHRIALYPISTGKNWGLGSKLPVVDGCVVVDLSRMHRIVEVSEAFGYAILEPGVTQAQLAAHLAASYPSLTLNFTGSFAHTSIVGNVLERGDGAHARVDDLLGVRGVLGDGTPFEVGGCWRHVGSAWPSHCSRYTAGPDLVGMFAQSSFGIVTQMAFRLIHKPERRYLLWGAAPDEALERLVDTFDAFGRQRVINRGSVNIGYENRFVQARPTLGGAPLQGNGPRAWNFFALLGGTAVVADALAREMKTAFGTFCLAVEATCVEGGEDAYRPLPPFLHPLVKPLLGSPDSDSIRLIYDLTGTPLPADLLDLDVDLTPFGMKCCIPVVPPRGEHVRRAARVVTAVAGESKLNVKLSVFGDGRALVTIHFRSDDPDQVERAEQCERMLWGQLVAEGFPPYRVGIDQMERLVALDPAYFDLVARLKSVLDPHNVIAPGRYSRR